MRNIIYGPDHHDEIGRFVCDRINKQWIPEACTAIGLEENGEIIAGVLYDDFNGANVCMHVASLPGKKWMTREYLWFCFHYPFEQLCVKRITGLVAGSNAATLNFDKHLGFIEEARLHDAHPDGDIIVLVMRKEDCRFLRGRNVHKMAA